MGDVTKIVKREDGRFYLQTAGGEWFENEKEQPRSYTAEAGAMGYLKRMCKRYTTVGFEVRRTNGRVVYLGTALRDAYYDCDFRKAHMVTEEDAQGNMYDLMACTVCGTQVRRYGWQSYIAPRACLEQPKSTDTKEGVEK